MQIKDIKKFFTELIVVEHDVETIRNADYIIDIGPGDELKGEKL